jgi:hypothetical protein
MKVLVAGVLAWGAAYPLAAVAQSAQGDVSVTIYNNDLALVQDIRQLNLGSGLVRQEFPDVSAQIKPETVTIGVPNAGIVEQNFDYDLLTPARLLDKSVGQTVTLVRTNPATGAETSETAQVLANNQGTLLKIGDRIEVLEGYNGRIVFPSLPAGLKASPTLSVTLASTRAGPRPLTLSYLSQGFEWKADYVALFDEQSGKIDVQGWITLHNSSGTSFDNAKVLLVAGQVGQDGDTDNTPRGGFRARGPSGNQPGIQSAQRERLGDFYVYPIAGRTTLANQQQKQVSFLDVKGAAASKGYVYRNDWLSSADEAKSFDTVLRFSTAREGGLGDALPKGTVRVYLRDAHGQPQFIGENGINHTPMGSSLAIRTGEAFDVKVQPSVEKRERIDSDEWARVAKWRVSVNGGPPEVTTWDRTVTYWRTNMRYKITNARPQPVTVEVVQAGLDDGWWHATRVSAESVKGEQRTIDERTWLVTVPANGEAVLTAQFDTRY